MEEDFDEVAYEREQRVIEEMFPSSKFHVCITVAGLEKVLSNEPQIIIKCSHNCYCYDNAPRNTDYIVVKGNGNPITVKDAVKEMCRRRFDPGCNHNFLEAFWKTKNSEVQFEPFFGS